MMLKMITLPSLLLVLFMSLPVFAEGPYEAIGTVTNYDPLRHIIVLDGTLYKLKGNANSNLIVSIREAGLRSLKGMEVSYQIDSEGNGNVIVDVHIPENDDAIMSVPLPGN
jgi:hypothetical protein